MSLNYIQYFVVLSFVLGLILIEKKYRIVKILLIVVFFTELITNVFSYLNKEFTIVYNISFILHNSVWIYIIFKELALKRKLFLVIGFMFFGVINLLFIEKDQLNYFTFIFGSLIYLFSYSYLIIKKLKNADIVYFQSNELILTTTPVLFFIGFSIMFAFQDIEIWNFKVFDSFYLYVLVSNFINSIYYILLLIFIIKQRNK